MFESPSHGTIPVSPNSTPAIPTMESLSVSSYIRSRRTGLAVMPLLCAAALLVAACGGSTADGETDNGGNGAASAATGELLLGHDDVATASEAEIGRVIQLSGPLSPKDQAVLRAQVSGTISDQSVDNGSRVQAGQRLLIIKAEGVVSQAAGAQAAVAAAQANVAVAAKQLDAAKALFDAGAMSAIERQSAEAGYEAAQAQLAAAKAQAAGADEAAGRTSVRAPYAGVISNRRKQNGEPVSVGDELLTVVNSQVLELPGQIGVTDAVHVKPGQSVVFSLDAFPGETFSGRVARMDPVANPGTRQVGVYVDLPNSNGRVMGGQFARGQITLNGSKSVIVPGTAVLNAAADGSGGSVYVIADGKLMRRPVVVGARDEATGMIAIVSGVRAGEQVLRTPSDALRDGTPARVLSAGDASPSATPTSAGSPDSASAAKE